MSKVKRFFTCAAVLTFALMCAALLGACNQKKVTVTLDAQGGVCEIESIAAHKDSLLAPPPAPVKEGCVFSGWYTDKSAAEKSRWSFFKDKVKGDMTLYAGYSEEADYITVGFNAMAGGDVVDNLPPSYNVRANCALPEPSEPSRSGYAFKGWYADSRFESKWDFSENAGAADMILYAKWVKLYTVSFETGESGVTVNSVQAEYGSPLKAAVNPSKDGKVFMGWFKDEKLSLAYELDAPVVSDLTLYAKWKTAAKKEDLIYESYNYSGVVVTGFADGFSDGEIVIPEKIDGKKVVQLNFFGASVKADTLVLPLTVEQFYLGSNELKSCEVSAANPYLKSHGGCVYKIMGNDLELLVVPEKLVYLDLLPNAKYYYYKGGIVTRVHTACDAQYSFGWYFIVPDKFYDGYYEKAFQQGNEEYIIKESEVDFEKSMIVKDDKLLAYFGDADSLRVGGGDGITSLGDGALSTVKEVIIGKDIAAIDRAAGNWGYNTKVKCTFEGDCPAIGDKYYVFPNIENVEFYIDYRKIDDFLRNLGGSLYQYNFQVKESDLLDGKFLILNDKLLRCYGRENVVRLPDNLEGVYAYAFGAHVNEIYFGKIKDTVDEFSCYNLSYSGYSNVLFKAASSVVKLYLPINETELSWMPYRQYDTFKVLSESEETDLSVVIYCENSADGKLLERYKQSYNSLSETYPELGTYTVLSWEGNA